MSEGLTLTELDMEQASYLPPREVMWGCRCYSHTEVNNVGSFNGNANGNTYQEGFINVSALNGNLNGNGNGNTLF